MTVETDDTVERYTISGTGPYAFSFRIFAETDLAVTALSTDTPPDPASLTYLTHYTVAGANDADGGTVTLTSAAAATYAGYTLDIRSNTPNEQPTSIRNLGRFLPEIHEDAFDNLSRQIQDLRRIVNACIRYPDNMQNDGAMSPIQSWISKYLAVGPTGVVEPAELTSSGALTSSIISTTLDSLKRTSAEIAAGVTPVNYAYAPLNVFRYMSAVQVTDVTTRALTLDVRAAIQDAISVAQESGGTVYLPAGSYLINRVAGGDSQFNGLHVPFTNVFGYDEHIVLRGDGRATVLCAGDNNMAVVRWSDSLGKLSDFVIDNNGKTGVTGLLMTASDVTDVPPPGDEQHCDWNVISRVDIRGCAEGIELECTPNGGCYFNRFEWLCLAVNTRHIRFRDSATIGGANRNTFIGLNFQGGTYGVDIDGADTNAFIHCNFDGVATAVRTNLVGTLFGLGTSNTQLLGCTWEDCVVDLDCGNRRISIIGGNCGAADPPGFGAITGEIPDLHLGGDAEYKFNRNLQLGSTSIGLRLQPEAVVYSAQAQIATSSNQAGAYPFNGDGHLIIQGRNSNTHDITVRTGASSTERLRVAGNGHINTLNTDFSLHQSSSAPAITNGATITTAGVGVARVAPASAVTGIILEAGTQPGQVLVVVNQGSDSLTFATFGTSRVADGTSSSIASNRAAKFIWNSSTNAWYNCA